jgi:hypothetical protein
MGRLLGARVAESAAQFSDGAHAPSRSQTFAQALRRTSPWRSASAGSPPSRSATCSASTTPRSPRTARGATASTRRRAFPDRVELRDLEPGEHALLLNFVHQPADNPYAPRTRSSVVEGAVERYDRVDEIPEVIRVRPISLRAFGADDCMVDASWPMAPSSATVDRALPRAPGRGLPARALRAARVFRGPHRPCLNDVSRTLDSM